MPLILAIEPDKRQAAQLKVLVKNRLRADLVLADTTELALEAIGNRIPDLVLVPALLSPEEDGALNQALRVIAAAAHVQTLTIPVFASSSAKKPAAKSGGLFSKLLPGKNDGAPEGCDPAVFGDQIAAYLAEVAANRQTEDDDFDDEPPAPPARSFARVETFTQPETFQDAVEDLQAATESIAPEPIAEPQEDVQEAVHEAVQEAVEEEVQEMEAAPADPEPEAEPEADPEPIYRPAEPPLSILRDPDAAPPKPRRSLGLDALLKPRARKPLPPPAKLDWPAYEPPAAEAAPEETTSDDDNDWAPKKDQSIAIDLPAPDAEETVEETLAPEPPLTPIALRRQQPWPKFDPPAPDPAPPDLLAEFTADLAARPKPVAAPLQMPKPKPAPPPAPRPPAPKAPPLAAKVAAREAKPSTATQTLKIKSERPEWSALIDSLRQDMDRMRQDRDGRSKAAAAPAAPPPPPAAPVRQRVEARRAEPPAPAAVAPEPPAARPAAKAAASKPATADTQTIARKKRAPVPVQDEWGFFDPQQCGFAALLAKLDEITENEAS